jgi:hypothetical protein
LPALHLISPITSRPAPVPWSAFTGFRFPPDVIVLAVRWYLRFGLSYRDVEELLVERSIYRWVQRFTPLLAEAARPCRRADPCGEPDHVDVHELHRPGEPGDRAGDPVLSLLGPLLGVLANGRSILGDAANGRVFRAVATVCVVSVGECWRWRWSC